MGFDSRHYTDSIQNDLQEIVSHSLNDLEVLVNQKVVITGSSGFIGTWLAMSWLYAHQVLNGTGSLLLTSRNPRSQQSLHEAVDPNTAATYVASDIRDLFIPEDFHGAYFVHAATPASETLNVSQPTQMLDIIIQGQRRVLSEATRTGSRRFLFLSSGAVYGKQPLDVDYLTEDWSGGPDITDPRSAYHEGKRVAELMGNLTAQQDGLQFVSARLFAFLAPFLPMDTHFAAGNFMKDAYSGRPIHIQSGGGSVRSYQYATDMCSWLWALLVRGGVGRGYNVGSDEIVTIRELAEQINQNIKSSGKVSVLGQDTEENVSRYVPDVSLCRSLFTVENYVNLEKAIMRTEKWLLTSNGKK